jgi:inner membrane protein
MGATEAARAVVADGIARAGRPAGTRFMVSPVVANPFTREVVVDAGDRYEKGVVWFEPLPHFRPSGFGMGKGMTDPLVQQALDTPLARDFLVWSRFPFASVDTSTSPPRVWLNDYRYANTGSGGWSATEVSHR